MILDALDIHEESWENDTGAGPHGLFGKYNIDEETAFYRAAEKYPAVKYLAYPLSLANYWTNDLQDWVYSVLLGEEATYHERKYEQKET